MNARIWAVGLVAIGCASELANSARTDDLAAFKTKLETARKATPGVDLDALREVAVAVAGRELVTAKDQAAEARVLEVAECAGPLEEPLETLGERGGVVGALALQVLIDAHRRDDDLEQLKRDHAQAKQDDWRAVGLRAATAAGDAPLRAGGFIDPDLRVRRAALRAAKDAHAPADVAGLLEVARLDPDRTSRAFALAALAALADADSMVQLRELWGAADEQERLEITKVWSSEAAFAVGGEEQLSWVLASQTGVPQLAAAVTLASRRTEPVAQSADDLLATAITSGPIEEARYAMTYAPASSKVTKALGDAVEDKDEAKAVAAAVALVRVESGKEPALARLRELRRSNEPRWADAAGFALAASGDREARAWLDAQLTAKDPERRLIAGLVRLGDGSDATAVGAAATLLADPDASVRVRFACWALRNERPALDYLNSQVRP